MAIIYSYPKITSLNTNDRFIISKMDQDNNPTKSLSFGDLVNQIIPLIPPSPLPAGTVSGTGTTNYIMKWTDGPNSIAGDSKLFDNTTDVQSEVDFVLKPNGAGPSAGSVNLDFKGVDDLGVELVGARIFTTDSTINPSGQDLHIQNASDAGTLGTNIFVDAFGFVGVGTITPAANLDVAQDLVVGTDVTFSDYGSGTKTGTSTYNLAVDANGNVIEEASSGGGIGGTGTIDALPIFTAATTLGDSLVVSTSGGNGIGINMTPGAGSTATLRIESTGAGGTPDVMQLSSASASCNIMLDQSGGTPFGYYGNACVAGGAATEMQLRSNNDLLFSSGGSTEHMRLKSAGDLQLPLYGSGTFTGTATFGLSVDANGNIIETASGGGGVAWPTEYDAALGNLLQGENPGTTQVGTTTYGVGAGASLSTPAGGAPGDSGNTAFGFNALGSENSEGSNTAIGYRALGNQNVSSMFAIPGNTALGYEAGKECTTGLSNVFVGRGIQSVNSGQSVGNVVLGSNAMEQLGTGFANVAIGERAMQNVNSNTGNIAIGYTANNGNTTGNENIVIGYNAQPSSLAVSNEITLGNSSTAVLRCQQTSITALSDQRDKTSIEDLPYGLDFVDSLQPKKFVWDNRAEFDGDGNEYFSANKGSKDIGFIAQELQTVDDEWLNLVYDSNPERLEASYGKLIPVLVKAIKELKAKVEALEA